MKCHKCSKLMKHTNRLKFNKHKVDGWKCICGEEYYAPEKLERILLLNKLKKHKFHLKLSQVKSNLILRIPKKVSDALDLRKGEEVEFGLMETNDMVIHPLTNKK